MTTCETAPPRLFAALEVATGKVTDGCYDRHGKAEFLDFLKKVARAYPRRELHVVVDNYHTHKHAEINAWLAKTRGSPCISPRPPVLAEPGRGVLRDHHPPGHPPRHLHQRQRTHRRHQPFIDGWNDAATPSSGPKPPTRSSPTPPVNEIQTRDTS